VLVPRLSLADVFGPGVVYVRRPSPSASRWLPREPGVVDFIAGGQTAIAGPMPVVCCEATAGPETLALLSEAGLPVEATLHTYRAPADYLATLARLATAGWRFAMQTQHAESEVPAARCFVDPELVRTVNDKGRLAELVPPDLVARRRVYPPADLPPSADLVGERGVVLKAANRAPSGAGASVRVCRTPSDVDRARAEMAEEPGIVVEELLDVARSSCVHALVRDDGTVEPLGVAEQVCDADGGYHGNWLDAASDALVPEAVVESVRSIVGRAGERGYRGFAGIDVAFLPDGRARVLDLNFRMNGSTPAVCLREALERGRGARVVRSRSFRCDSSFDALLGAARRAVARGTLVPLSLYDPRACAGGGVPRMSGLVLGPSRGAVREEEERLAAEGVR
jgi:hypothetical protein